MELILDSYALNYTDGNTLATLLEVPGLYTPNFLKII